MKSKSCLFTTFIHRFNKLLILPALLVSLMAIWPPMAQAATSANATIFNEVTVTYSSGTQNYSKSDDVSVIVTTLATAPTVTVNHTTDTAAAGTSISYVYTVRSNSNGPDTYAVTTPVVSTNTGVSAPTNSLSADSITLWAGIVVGSGDGYIELPGGSMAMSGLVVGETVELNVDEVAGRYSVVGIKQGTAASSGTGETYDQLTLSPIEGSAITGTNVNIGDQVGQYGIITFTQIVGIPTTLGTDGTHTTSLTFTTTATDVLAIPIVYSTRSSDSNLVTTTVTNPRLSIEKASRNATTNGSFATDGSTKAKPGEVIEYQITVTNMHSSAAVTAVSITDTIPDYTTFEPGQYLSGKDVKITTSIGTVITDTYATDDADEDVATLSGSNLAVNMGTGATNVQGGSIAGGDSVVILFSVKVD